MDDSPPKRVPRPAWLRVSLPSGEGWRRVSNLLETHKLHTVCRSANCPNVGDCWSRGTATFMILGDVCTRDCRFCAVGHGQLTDPDPDEPMRVAEAVAILGLKYAVITSVTRDDLPDGGASLFAETVRAIHERVPGCRVELLVPDFQGDAAAIHTVTDSDPEVFGHNIETVPRLYSQVRPQADYARSLAVLRIASEAGAVTKSGIMLGLGESADEVRQVMRDARAAGTRIFTLGQYLQPTRGHLPVERFVTPEEFAAFRAEGLAMGFAAVESGPLVRSSYHAEEVEAATSSLRVRDNG